MLLKALGTILVTMVLIEVESNFIKKPVFNIKNVEITKLSSSLERDMEKLRKDLLGKNIYDINIDFLKEMLSNDVRIKEVAINKKGLNSLSFNIAEREVKYYAQINSKFYLVDEDGVVFGKINEREKKDLPIFHIKNLEETSNFIKILEKMEQGYLKDMVSQVYTKDQNCILMILTDGTLVKTNLEVARDKYFTGEMLYLDLVKNKKVEYMDLRFQDFIVKCLGAKDEK